MWPGFKLRVKLAGGPRKLAPVRQVRFVSNRGGYLLSPPAVKHKSASRTHLAGTQSKINRKRSEGLRLAIRPLWLADSGHFT
ncbi:protein of unknown function [Pararobbsia alpina]